MTDGSPSTEFETQSKAQIIDLIRYGLDPWALASFGLPLLPLLMLLSYDLVDRLLSPIASLRVGGPISLVTTAVIALLGYTLRDELHRYTHTRSFSERPHRSLTDWALRFFVAAIALSFVLGFGIATSNILVAMGPLEPGMVVYGGPGHLLLKLLMTGSLVLTFICLSLLAGLMAAYAYGEAVDRAGGDKPLYTDEVRLQRKVLQAARAQLDLGAVSVAEMSRRHDGGLSLVLQRKGELIQHGDDMYREDRTWRVDANHEGELIRVEEQEVRQTKAEGFEIDLVLSEVREVLDTTGPLTVAGMRRMENGEVQLTIVHRGTRWIARADRWNRLIEIEPEERRGAGGDGEGS